MALFSKKITMLLSLAALAFFLFACGDDNGTGSSDNIESSSSSHTDISDPLSSSSLQKISSSSMEGSSSATNNSSSSAAKSSSSMVPESSSSGKEVSSSSSLALKECEGIWNPESKFCYDGTLYNTCDGIVYDPPTQFCRDMVIYSYKCDGKAYNNFTQFCSDNSIYEKCGGKTYDLLTQGCKDEVVLSKCGELLYDSSVEFCSNSGIKKYSGVFIDTRDNKSYKYTEIGTQTWMSENLNYVPETGNSWCYGADSANCDTYGRLYDWDTAMEGAASSAANPSGVQGICPDGWHLPSHAEWSALGTFVGYNGTALKSKTGWDGTDDYGFDALPNILDVSSGYWWSATTEDYVYYGAYGWNVSSGSLGSYIDSKSSTYAVRCVKD
ncbi:MAG: hypothetical protein LBR60_03670 [Fibrobacter sp.]|jgi:uncharacterized protein (TIGR02145 family)|nr:hypothetical protein [Fibrobacter sp.]